VTIDRFLGLAGLMLGAIGLWATIWAAMDARRQRSAREKAVIAAHAVVERTYGLLIGLKPGVAPPGTPAERAINDGLEAINQRRSSLADL